MTRENVINALAGMPRNSWANCHDIAEAIGDGATAKLVSGWMTPLYREGVAARRKIGRAYHYRINDAPAVAAANTGPIGGALNALRVALEDAKAEENAARDLLDDARRRAAALNAAVAALEDLANV